MDSPVNTLFTLLAGASFIVAVLHLIVTIGEVQKSRAHILFAISITPLPFYAFASSQLYASSTVESILAASRIQMFCIALAFIMYPRFLRAFLQIKTGKQLHIITLFYTIVPFLRASSPTLLMYKEIYGIKTVTLPWGETLSTILASITPFGYFYFLFILYTILYFTWLSAKGIYYNRKGAIPALIVQITLILASLNDILVDILLLEWVYMGEFAFASSIVLMGVYLIKDMIEGLRLQQTLQKKEQQLTSIIGSSGAILFAIDSNKTFSLVNQEFSAITGISEDEIIHKRVYDFSHIPFIYEIATQLSHCISTGTNHSFETVLTQNENQSQYFYTTIVPTGDNKEKQNFVGLSTEITEVYKLREILSHSERLSSIGTIASGIAHDLKNQLGAIIGMADLIEIDLADKKESELYSYAQTIVEVSEKSASLVKEILALSRKEEREKSTIDLSQLLESVHKLLFHAIDRRVTLTFNYPPDPISLYCYVTAVENTLLNLGINAFDALPDKGTITCNAEIITLTNEITVIQKQLPPARYVVISVSDTGPGIPENIREQIFSPFFTTKKRGHGTGLGLSAVWNTMEDHNGGIALETSQSGSCFRLYFPLDEHVSNTANL